MRWAVLAAVAVPVALAAPAGARLAVPHASLVAVAPPHRVLVYARPGDTSPARALPGATTLGTPRVFLVVGRSAGWLDVLLPARPNGSTGWIREAAVSLVETTLAVRVELRAHVLTQTRGGVEVLRTPIGAGRWSTPTPVGLFYVTDVVAVGGDPGGYYGPFAIGLSAFSETLRSFHGAPAQIAIHGTNDPSSIGRDTSNGCIHVANAAVTRLAHLLPLGTPVLIVP
jgi:lipoprotein-anchoring transpeptidase ErfK/SrfK